MYIYDIFQTLFANSKPAPEVDYQWEEDSSYIVDYLAVIEQHLGKRLKDAPMPWEREGGSQPVSIAVEVEDEDDAEAKAPKASAKAQPKTPGSKKASKKAKSRKTSSKKEDS